MLKRTPETPPRHIRTIILLGLAALACSQLIAEPSSYSLRRGRPPRTIQRSRPGRRPRAGGNSGAGSTRPQQEPTGKMIQVTVLDQQGNIVEDALIGSSMLNNEKPADKLPFGRLDIPSLNRRTIGGSGSGGSTIGFFSNRNSTPHKDKAVLYALQKERKLCALRELSETDANEPVTLELGPACRVFGQMTCSTLTNRGLSLSEGKIDLYWKGYNPLCRHTKGLRSSGAKEEFYHPSIEFEFFLPPGEYGIRGYSTHIVGEKRVTFTVKAGQADFNLGAIDLAPASAAKLIGRKAPPIGPVKAWINGKAMDPAKTKGKNLLLCFGKVMPGADMGTRTSASPPIRTSRLDPTLRKLGLKQSGVAGGRAGGAGAGVFDYVSIRFDQLLNLAELFEDDLVIVAIYSPASEKQAKAMIAKLREGAGQSIPISVAIDARDTSDGNKPLNWTRYEVKNRTTAVMIDGNGNVVGALDHTPYGEEIERAFKMNLSWRREFLRRYALNDGEFVKHIARPPLAVRRNYWLAHPQIAYRPDQPATILFAWENGECREREFFHFNSPGAIHKIFRNILGVISVQTIMGDPDTYPRLAAMKGDWIFRPQATYQQKSKALENILSRQLRKAVSLQLQRQWAPTVTVSGDYRYQSISPSDRSGAIHVFAENFDPARPGPIARAESVAHLLRQIGEQMGITLTVRSANPESGPVRYTVAPDLGAISHQSTATQRLNRILDNLTRQTNLKFELDTTTYDEKVFIRPRQ